MTSPLPKLLQPALKALEKDLLTRARLPAVESGLRIAWEGETSAGQTGLGFDPWRRDRVTQVAVAWILSLVFVRTLEDRALIDPRVSGPNAEHMRAAEDREAQFLQLAPFLGIREYLLAVFRELSKLPGTRDVFDTKHNPVWVLSPSSEGAQSLVDFFRKRDATGVTALVFAGEDTRFLGDLYQDLSEAVRKRYALLQTPEFVEEFILDQTLDPAIAEFGLKDVTLIDPTCGSGHFLLGAFRRLLGRWQRDAPTENTADLARRALDQVYGVDINPYAVAIARFRLVLALLDAVGIKRLERAPDIKPNVVVADSLLHRFGAKANAQIRFSEQISMDDIAWGDQLFRLENHGDVERVLTKRFHAVVGNPPYIVEADSAKKAKYREMYKSAAGKFALSAPFTERFFDLAVASGFVGLINSNAWTKRDFGSVLIEQVLGSLDLKKVIDTSGCYLPGHGTPTLLLFGRNRSSEQTGFVAVLGKRGETIEPPDPATAPVWSEIVQHHDEAGFEGRFISVARFSETEGRTHPWVLAGGGARTLLSGLSRTTAQRLGTMLSFIGRSTHTGDDAFFALPVATARRLRGAGIRLVEFVRGQDIDDWQVVAKGDTLFPYEPSGEESTLGLGESHWFWPQRQRLRLRRDFGKTIEARGLGWHAHSMFFAERYRASPVLGFAFVATHNHFVISRGGRVFNRSAPALALQVGRTDEDHLALLGYLNSSLVGLWCRLVMFPKGGDQVGDGARLSATQWNRHLEYAGNLLQQLPVPKVEDLRTKLLDLVVAAEETVAGLSEHAPEKVVASALTKTPTLAQLRDARTKSLAERVRLRGILISLQEEIDWRVYGLFALPTVEAPSVDSVRVPVQANHRPIEVRLAREVATDISSSEWFRVHKRGAPKDVDGPLGELYRQRLRLLDDPVHGMQLRLLETPETKRRWSPSDDAKAFSDAVRSWLLDRIEASFRDQPAPELRTARQLALELGHDPAIAAVHELLTEESGLDLVKLLSELVDREGVPFLAGYRYTETGMEKRVSWEETWRLQRLEDEDPKKLEAEFKRLSLKSLPVPDKYGQKDFLHHHWSLRGKLDVPKERFVTVPGGNTDEDTTPLVGWAGWDHLKVAKALAGLYQRRKDEDGWAKDRLVPLLAGLDERVFWFF